MADGWEGLHAFPFPFVHSCQYGDFSPPKNSSTTEEKNWRETKWEKRKVWRTKKKWILLYFVSFFHCAGEGDEIDQKELRVFFPILFIYLLIYSQGLMLYCKTAWRRVEKEKRKVLLVSWDTWQCYQFPAHWWQLLYRHHPTRRVRLLFLLFLSLLLLVISGISKFYFILFFPLYKVNVLFSSVISF